MFGLVFSLVKRFGSSAASTSAVSARTNQAEAVFNLSGARQQPVLRPRCWSGQPSHPIGSSIRPPHRAQEAMRLKWLEAIGIPGEGHEARGWNDRPFGHIHGICESFRTALSALPGPAALSKRRRRAPDCRARLRCAAGGCISPPFFAAAEGPAVLIWPAPKWLRPGRRSCVVFGFAAAVAEITLV